MILTSMLSIVPLWKDFFDKSIKIADFTINYSELKKGS